MDNNRVVIIGSGLTGLSTAYHLKKPYVLLEKEPTPGGLSKSVFINGFKFDYTGHLLHFRKIEIKTLVLKLLSNNIWQHKRNSWIYLYSHYTPYPFQTNTYGLPKNVVKDCVIGFIETLCNPKKSCSQNPSFYDWSIKSFGTGISKHFMLPYNKKLFLTNLTNLTCEWMGSFVPKTSLHEILDGALTDQSTRAQGGYNANFYYPRKGAIQSLVNCFTNKIKQPVFVNSQAVKIDLTKKIVVTTKNEVFKYSTIVSSIPLPELINSIYPTPVRIKNISHLLKTTSCLCINLGVARKNVGDKHWIYFPEHKYPYYRIGFQSNFAEDVAPKNSSSLYIEISLPANKKFDRDKIIGNTLSTLYSTNILNPKDVISELQTLYIPHSYVIFDKNHKFAVNELKKYLIKNNIYSIGRYGGWEYSTMEDAIYQGKQIAGLLNNK